MVTQDIAKILDVHSMIIDGISKSGKMTFVAYLINSLFKTKAIIFTAQESYLYNRRLDSLSLQFEQFTHLKTAITTYYLKEDWNAIKQRYGYAFLIQELVQLIITSEEKVIVFHRLGEFFEFQDRYEIENFYKTLTKTAVTHNKKIIFLVNNKSENFEYIYNVAQEFSDISISLKNNENNERLVSIQDILRHKEYPLMKFRFHEDNFIFSYNDESAELTQNKVKNILIAELNQAHDNMKDIFTYIFDRKNFSVKHADSLQSILEEIFIAPDILIALMSRKQENLETISAIKRQLPDIKIVGIIDQEFIRTEDIQEAYEYGCDELFAYNLSMENLILALQKSVKMTFYSDALKMIPKYNNIVNSLDDFKTLAIECKKNSIFFTAFSIESDVAFEKVTSTSRKHDYIYQEEKRIYYLAINTIPRDVEHIISGFRAKNPDMHITCIWEPLNHIDVSECIS